MESKERVDAEFAWGAKAIGAAIGCTERKTYHLLETGLLPARKVGGRWVAARRVLRQHLIGGMPPGINEAQSTTSSVA